MTELKSVPCEKQVLICTNSRPGEKSCCSRVGGQEFFEKFKRKMKEAGRSGAIWVTRTGCLGYCNDVGTTVVMYQKHESRWYTQVKSEDFDNLWIEATQR